MTGIRQQVDVSLGERSYTICVGTGLLSQTAATYMSRGEAVSHVVVISDANVTEHADVVAKSWQAAGVRVVRLSVPAGEGSKSIAEADRLWQEMLRCGTDRKSLVVAVGGGVVGDLAGFVAATFARGIRFLQIPTTLLAQVDSSVGGKTGINLPSAKNMVGAFWQPSFVLIDIDVLSTLPDREYRSGLAEVVKYGVILDADFFNYLEAHAAQLNARDPEVLCTIVARCCRLKADVVEQDERETSGLRAVLNYGHTFAHAFEAIGGYGQLLHGEAVSIGMVCASRLAASLGRIDAAMTQRQVTLLRQLDLPVVVPDLDHQLLCQAMAHDKKVEHGRLRFVLPTRMGHVELVADVNSDLVVNAMRDGN
ncbi:MAG: 3-dehydroquinate synthase [Planctomycetales bacterium]|nr:3-dehydroquinate synthase [Planctomycetales bacterium]MCA9167442.1 3-dehydroquinate synthase [Planctomycetales bacterium]